jgi:Ni,Fe-hydrogenase III small subunit
MRAIVTGNRTWTNAEAIRAALRTLPESSTVVHGGCPTGADIIADRIARAMGHVPEVHPAEWHVHGNAAGPIRNQAMVDLGADVCLAFGELQRMKRGRMQNTGTGDCVERCRKAGIRVVHVP